jgi:hypothetical protein
MVYDENIDSAVRLSWQERYDKAAAKRKADLNPLPSNPKHRFSWHEALAYIDPPNADRWPDALTLNDCVALQSEDEASQGAMLEGLAIDCGMGFVKCKVEPDVEYRQDLMRFTWTSRDKLIPSGVLTTIEAGRCYRVSANDFKEWLQSLEKAPSPHIQNWFEAVGVSYVASSKPLANVQPDASESFVKKRRDVKLRMQHHLDMWKKSGLELKITEKNPQGRFPKGIAKLAEGGWGVWTDEPGNRSLFVKDLNAMGIGDPNK